MAVTLEFSPEHEAVLRARAGSEGLSVEQWLVKFLEQWVSPDSIVHLQKTDPAEWARRFDAWVDSHDPNLPVLSDEDMSRESIYSDRG